MRPTHVSPLQKALEIVEALPPGDQETLIDVIRRRLIELRRNEIAANAEATLRAVREGKAQFGSVDDLKNYLLTARYFSHT
jgi:hypothetical protein